MSKSHPLTKYTLSILSIIILILTTGLVANGQCTDVGFNSCADGGVLAIAVQPDGKILVGGSFSHLGCNANRTGGSTRKGIGRLNPDGNLDTSFDPNPGTYSFVKAIAVQSDGKILIGGTFSTLGGSSRNYIGRLNSDGSLDTDFNPGANNVVEAIALQSDGKILVGGQFTTLGGSTRNGIGRLNPDGSLDTFNPGTNGEVQALVVQPDGNILVGGQFTQLGTVDISSFIPARGIIGRLDPNNDTGSNAVALAAVRLAAHVNTIALQPDGTSFNILVGGEFDTLYQGNNFSTPFVRYRIAQFDSGGSITSFNPFNPLDFISSIKVLAVQTDGKILVGGRFTKLGGVTRNNIGRLNSDGSLDTDFNPGASFSDNSVSEVDAIALQTDILVGGFFNTLGGITRNNIGRLGTPTITASGPTTFCAGGSVTLTASAGSSYLWSTGATTQSITASTSGSYTVTVTDATGCIATSAATVVTVNPLPTTFSVTGGGAYCSGGSGVPVGLSGSEVGVNYQLKRDGSDVGSPVAGTGLALNFGSQTMAGTYTVQATNATTFCMSTMNGSVTVTVNTPPTVMISGTTSVCSGSSTTLTANPAGGSGTYSSFSWTGPNNFTSTSQSISASAAGTYSVTVTDSAGCTATASVMVTVNPLPTIFNVTGGGAYCSGGSGVPVGLSGSEVGVNYQLKKDGSDVGSPVAGTGLALNFGSQTTAGTYTVQAKNASTGCMSTMNGSAIVTVNPLPTATVSGGGTICSGGGPVTISAALTGKGPWSVTWSDNVTQSNIASSPATRSVSPTITTTYTVTNVTDANCSNTGSGSATVVVTTCGNTQAGNNVSVQLVDSATGTMVTVTFSNVTQPGNTSLTTSSTNSTGQPPPAGFKPGSPAFYYDLTTTAGFSGPVIVCINYTGVSFGNESKLGLFHFENNAWVYRTTSLDTTNNIICASVTSLSPFAIFEATFPTATINVIAALQAATGTSTNPGSLKAPLELKLKVFDKATVGSPDPKDFGTIWSSGLELTLPYVSISGPTQVSMGGGAANLYMILLPSADPDNANISSGSYLVIGQTKVNGLTVYVGSPTDPLATGSITQKYLQVVQTGSGKVLPAKTAAIPGSLLLIAEPEYLEITSNEELLPIVYESVEGDWSSVVQAETPSDFVGNPGALQASVSTNGLQVLQFTIKAVGSSQSTVQALGSNERSARVTHHLKHKGKDITVTFDIPLVNKKK